MTELVGSEKQIKWGQDIKDNFILNMNSLIERIKKSNKIVCFNEPEALKHIELLNKHINTIADNDKTEAKYWVEKRDNITALRDKIIDQMYTYYRWSN